MIIVQLSVQLSCDSDWNDSAHLLPPPAYGSVLQRVLNAAARLVTGTRKFDRGLERLLHDDLHWLDVPERVQFKLGLTVRRCLRRRAPRYLVDYCTSVADVVSRQHLRSASRRQLVVSTRSAVGPSQ